MGRVKNSYLLGDTLTLEMSLSRYLQNLTQPYWVGLGESVKIHQDFYDIRHLVKIDHVRSI
jgi:hypothetical protein